MKKDKTSQCLSDLIGVFQKYNLDVAQLLRCYGNLGYALGASIEGYKEKGPGLEELRKEYYANPRPGIALMIQGWQTTTWEQDVFEIQRRQREQQDNEKDQEN